MAKRTIVLRLSVTLMGAFCMMSTPNRALAAGISASARAQIDGVVISASDTTLQLRPPIGTSVTLTLTSETRLQWVGRHSAPGAPSLPEAGQYARAQYDLNTLVATRVALGEPAPIPAAGLVKEASDMELSLTLPDGRILEVAVDAETIVRINGRPGSNGELAAGDRAMVLFLLEGAANRALRVNAVMAPPRSFDGVVTISGANSFSAMGRGGSLTFQVDANTAIRLNGKPLGVSELKPKQPVQVLYRARGGSLLALRVNARPVKGAAPSVAPAPGSSSVASRHRL
jgi:hypothetical protein